MSIFSRHRAGQVLVNAGAERALERREMQLALQAASPQTSGHAGALEALQVAKFAEDALLWLGWRLAQPTLPSQIGF
jgi:hypothetical protein